MRSLWCDLLFKGSKTYSGSSVAMESISYMSWLSFFPYFVIVLFTLTILICYTGAWQEDTSYSFIRKKFFGLTYCRRLFVSSEMLIQCCVISGMWIEGTQSIPAAIGCNSKTITYAKSWPEHQNKHLNWCITQKYELMKQPIMQPSLWREKKNSDCLWIPTPRKVCNFNSTPLK